MTTWVMGLQRWKPTSVAEIMFKKNQQSGSQTATVICIKEEVREENSEFPEQFEIFSSEKSLWCHEISDVKDEVTEMETDFPVKLEFFNSDQCVSDHEIIKTNVKGEVTENLSALSGKENTQDKKHPIFEQNISGRKVKEEVMEKDVECLPKYFDEYNIIESYTPQKSILKSVKSEIAENEAALTRDSKFQISEKRIAQKSNTVNIKKEVAEIETDSPEQLEILTNNKCFSDQISIADVKDAVTDKETHLLFEIKNIKTCDSAETLNDIFIKEEVIEHDLESLKDFETLNWEQSGSVDKILITNVKGGVIKNETNFPGELRGQNVEMSVSEQISNAVIVKDEQIEIETELPDYQINFIKQVFSKDKREEKTIEEHKCIVCHKCFRYKSNLSQHMKVHEKEIRCEICDKYCSSREGVSKHMNVHTKEKEYKCKLCDKIFYRERSLYDHMNMHTKERKYNCKFCDKIFSRKSSLSDHLNLHILRKKRTSVKFVSEYFTVDACYSTI